MFLNPWYSGQQQNGSIPGVQSSLPGISGSSGQPDSGIGNSVATTSTYVASSSPSISNSSSNKSSPPPPLPPHQRNGLTTSISISTSNINPSHNNPNSTNSVSGSNSVTFSNEVTQFSDNNSVYSCSSHGESNPLLVNGVTGVGVLQSENHYMLTSELGFTNGTRGSGEGSLAGIGMANSLFPLSEEQNNHLQDVQRYLKPGWTVHLTPEGRYYYCK